jgi:hypothetical protein
MKKNYKRSFQNSRKKMLQEHFGLERPEWFYSDYYLGW